MKRKLSTNLVQLSGIDVDVKDDKNLAEVYESKNGLSMLIQFARQEPNIPCIVDYFKEYGIYLDKYYEDAYPSFMDFWVDINGKDKGNYFKYRYGTNSFISGFLLIEIMSGISAIDIGSGVGHFSHILGKKMESVLAVDGSFVNLLALSRYFLKKSSYLCCDLNKDLALADLSFDNVFSSDCLHYIDDKRGLLREINRIFTGEGLVVFNHTHHTDQAVKEVGMGKPIRHDQYLTLLRECFPQYQIHFYSEDYFIKTNGLNEPDRDDLSSPMIYIIGNIQRDELESKLKLNIKYERSDLIVNPLYAQVDKTAYSIKYPSEAFEREFYSPVFRDRVEYNDGSVMTNEDTDDLIRRGFLVLAPDNYFIRFIKEVV